MMSRGCVMVVFVPCCSDGVAVDTQDTQEKVSADS